MINMSEISKPKSDQLNNVDLISGNMVVTISGAQRNKSDDQPLSLMHNMGKPWKPCKMMRYVLIRCWGNDATQYVGRSAELFRDESVTWGGQPVGGIRIKSLSHIDRSCKVSIPRNRTSFILWPVEKLEVVVVGDAQAYSALLEHMKNATCKADLADVLQTIEARNFSEKEEATLRRALEKRLSQLN